jgi:hypothetical protein
MEQKSLQIYRNLLVEIKYRIEVIDQVLDKNINMRQRQKIAKELCFLQLRMICEIIAIGCLVVHGSISSLRSDLYKSYKADWIIKELEKIHPKFYPVSLEVKDDEEGGMATWVHRTGGYLTRAELSQLWGKHAGKNLHRGYAKNILQKERPIDFAEIKKWRDKIVILLTKHIIPSSDEQHVCCFLMDNGKGEVAGTLFKDVTDAL